MLTCQSVDPFVIDLDRWQKWTEQTSPGHNGGTAANHDRRIICCRDSLADLVQPLSNALTCGKLDRANFR
jgi:hypothetical protein